MNELSDLPALLVFKGWVAIQVSLLAFVAYALAPAAVYLLAEPRLRRQARSPARYQPPRTRFVLLVPAHDEAAALPQLLASIRQQAYPTGQFRTLVVADNCRDKTASVARQAGAHCLERTSAGPSSKTQALAYAAQALTQEPPGTVVCILDADCWLDAHFLRELNEYFARPGAAPVVQCARRVGNAAESEVALLDAAAEALRTQVGAATRQLVGLQAFVFGLGCCLRQEVFLRLMQQPGTTLAEDKEWKAWLLAHRVRVAHCPAARLSYQAVRDGAAFRRQRRRWLAGHWLVARQYGPRMLAQGLRRGSLSQLDFACDLLQPPRSVLLAVCLGLGALGLAGRGAVLLGGWPWLGAAAGLLANGQLGLHLVGVGPRYLRALPAGGRLVAGIVGTVLRLPFRSQAQHWEPTRPAANAAPAPCSAS